MNNPQQPKISIITCTYNSEKFLPKALHSIENQSYKNFEHIINDSYSNDATLDIIHDYIERNKHLYEIKLIQSEPKGVGNALNYATDFARGEIIHYLHSDDYYLNSQSLAKVALLFDENPDLVWLTGNFVVEWKGRKFTLPQTHILQPNLQIALSIMNFISHENTFMKTEAVKKYGGFNEIKGYVVEYSLWLKLLKDHRPMIINDEFTVFIIHKGSTSTGNIFKLSKAVFRAFRTQRKEHILPLLCYYQEKKVYKYYQIIRKKTKNLMNSLNPTMWFSRLR